MCGIAGIFDTIAQREIDKDALLRMTRMLQHRGPDGEGFHIEPGIGFGHRRLAIIDKAGGAQPFKASNGADILTFNGEIYNYQELATRLSEKSGGLRTRSDTEVLAEGLATEGPDYIEQLRGMFAFGFWSKATRTLLLARDRVGERPLYYALSKDGFLLFASEAPAIIASGMIDDTFDAEAISDYFYYGYTPDPKSIYKHIRKLPPASRLSVSTGSSLHVENYWRPAYGRYEDISLESAAERLRELLDDAVKTQLISDVPLGAFLSGGVDSSGVVASMAEVTNNITTCSIGFTEASHDERAYARTIAEKYQTKHHEHTVDSDQLTVIDAVASAFGEPFADSSALPSYLVAQLARRDVTVALSGDGGDELFAGYRRYPFHLKEEATRRILPLALRRAFFDPLGRIYPKLDWAPQPFRFKTTLQSLGLDTAEGYARIVAINLPEVAAQTLHGDLKSELKNYEPSQIIRDVLESHPDLDPLSAALHADFSTWLPARMLTKVDRASMAHSLEVRPPILDHRLVEWSMNIRPEMKLKGMSGKRVLKEALQPRLGREFLERKKQGFGSPLDAWFRRDNGNPIDRLNDSAAWRDSGLIDQSAVDRLFADHRGGRRNCGQELWSVVMFDAFLTHHKSLQANHLADQRTIPVNH